MGADGAAKICDFGAAREGADALTCSVQGTLAYMAPGRVNPLTLLFGRTL